MEKTKEKLLSDGIKALVLRLEKTEKFVLEQAPEICKEIIAEYAVEAKFDSIVNFTSSFFSLLLSLFLPLLLYICIYPSVYTYPSFSVARPSRARSPATLTRF